jgi:hypothetical protein
MVQIRIAGLLHLLVLTRPDMMSGERASGRVLKRIAEMRRKREQVAHFP